VAAPEDTVPTPRVAAGALFVFDCGAPSVTTRPASGSPEQIAAHLRELTPGPGAGWFS
jgi:hypothetical protein